MENPTNARPYAKAIFAIALCGGQFSKWQDTLEKLAAIVAECKKRLLSNNPIFFHGMLENFPEAINLVNMLTERKKLGILPDIAIEFRKLVLEHKKILEAKITTTCELSAAQKEKIINALQKRYQRQILLQCQIDDKLIGGGVIYIAGQVIDGSIKGMLHRLKQSL